MNKYALLALILLSQVAYSETYSELVERNKVDTSTKQGSAFEGKLVNEFWGDYSFMKICLPAGSPVHKPVTIYFEILTTGKIGKLKFDVNTDVTECIEKNVLKRKFSMPEKPFVAIIDLKFSE